MSSRSSLKRLQSTRGVNVRRCVLGEQLEARNLLAVVVWDGGAGTSHWEDALNWSGDLLPGPDDDVQIFAGAAVEHATNSAVSIHSLSSEASISFSGGLLSLADVSFVFENFTLSGSAGLTGAEDFFVAGRFTWSGGTMSGAGHTRTLPGAQLEIRGDTAKVLDGRTLINLGLVNWNAGTGVTLTNGAQWLSEADATWEMQSDVSLIRGSGGASSFTNNGTMVIPGGRVLSTEVAFDNSGVVEIAPGATLNAMYVATPGYLQSGGVTSVNGTLNALAKVVLDGGIVNGSGLIIGSVVNNAVVQPGDGMGTLTIDGNYTQSAAGTLGLQVGGSLPSQFDRLQVIGSVELAGSLNVTVVGDYSPDVGEQFPVMSHASRMGDFAPSLLPDLGAEKRVVVDRSSGLQTVLHVVSTVDSTAPVASVQLPSPNPHLGAVESLAIIFSEPVAGFDLTDLTLTRGSGADLLPGDASLSSADGVNWTLTGLSSITTAAGVYTLTLRAGGSNIADLAGNPLASAVTAEFVIESAVVGRSLFYNQSRFDGNNAAAGVADDAAIATDKVPLLPGGTSTFANYTSYGRGLNGIMIDIAGLPPEGLSASDFSFKVGNTSTPSEWATLPATPTVSVRSIGGAIGPSRISLIWPSGAAIKQWLQVTVKANNNTGLTEPDVFYFGSAVGEAGNVAGDYTVSITDELLARNNPVSISPGTQVTNRFDYNRDGTVSVVDQLLARNNITTGATKLKQITAPNLLTDELLRAQAHQNFLSDDNLLIAPTVAQTSSVGVRSTIERLGPSSSKYMDQPRASAVAHQFCEETLAKRSSELGRLSDELLGLIASSRRQR
jgi:hypothetical protein